MIVAVTGGRNYRPTEHAEDWLRAHLNHLKPFRVVHGGAEGADKWAGVVSKSMRIPVDVYHANWNKYGRAAGPVRNRQMARIANVLLVFPGGAGTKNMIHECKKRGVEVRVYGGD